MVLHYPEHLATAVCFDTEIPGDYMQIGGKHYNSLRSDQLSVRVLFGQHGHRTVLRFKFLFFKSEFKLFLIFYHPQQTKTQKTKNKTNYIFVNC